MSGIYILTFFLVVRAFYLIISTWDSFVKSIMDILFIGSECVRAYVHVFSSLRAYE